MKLAAFLLTIAAVASAQSKGDLEMLHVQGNVYLLAGAGGNIAVQIGPTGVLLVDTGSAASADKVLAAVRKLSNKPIKYIVNTHVHLDHIGGNEVIAKTSGTDGLRGIRGTPGESLTQIVQILAHDNVLQRLSDPAPGEKPLAGIAQPTDTWVGDLKDLFFNDEPLQILHVASAHTDGDSMVFFRRSDVIAAGDLINTEAYPVIDLKTGGNVQGIIDGLNRLLDLTVPQHHEEGGTYVIPGHGRVYDEFDVLEYRDMVTIIRDRIQAMMKKNMTLAQIKDAHPTRDYDPEYGSTSGPWTTDMFVEAVYRSLTPKK